MKYQKKIFDDFPNYSIDTDGVFRNEKKGTQLKANHTNGYAYVSISNKYEEKRVFAHHQVAIMFLNYFKGCHVHHKDGNKSNNNIENLECLTPFEHRRISFELKHTNKVDTPVDQYTINGTFVKSHKSLMAAYRDTSIDFRYISACLLGKQKSACGFLFTRKGDSVKKYSKNRSGRPTYVVYKYKKSGELVKKYDTLHLAYLDSNRAKSTIRDSIKNKTKVKGDFFWTSEPILQK